MSKRERSLPLFQKDLLNEALKQSFLKLNPKVLFRNPVMFTVEIGAVVIFAVCIWILAGETSQGSFGYNFAIFLILLLTVLFANFAVRSRKHAARPRPILCVKHVKKLLQKS